MFSFHSLSNHISRLATQTVQTGAHIFRTSISSVREWNVTSVPSKSVISDPFAFSARGGNPHSGFASLMNNRQSPLRVELDDFTIRNNFFSKWINNFDEFVSQNQLRSNPKQISKSAKNYKDQDFQHSLSSTCIDHQAIGRKERKQGKRNTRPNVIASGSKYFIHIPSMAGVSL